MNETTINPTFHHCPETNGFYAKKDNHHSVSFIVDYETLDDLFNDYQAGRVEWYEGF